MSMRLWKLGHPLLRVSDEEKARWFYCDVLGLKLAERHPEHGGLFTTLGGPDDPLPAWLNETWPAPEMQARIETLKAPVAAN